MATRKKKSPTAPAVPLTRAANANAPAASDRAVPLLPSPSANTYEEALLDMNDPVYRQAWGIVYVDDVLDLPEIFAFEDAFVDFTRRHSSTEITNAVRKLVETQQPRAVYAALFDKLKIIETAGGAADRKACILRGKQPKSESAASGTIPSGQFDVLHRIYSLVLNRAHKFAFWILNLNLEEIHRLGIDNQELLRAINSFTVHFHGEALQVILASIRVLDFAKQGYITVSGRHNPPGRTLPETQEITRSKLYDIVFGRPEGKKSPAQRQKKKVTGNWWNCFNRAEKKTGVKIKAQRRGFYYLASAVKCLCENEELSPNNVKVIEHFYSCEL